MTTTEAALPAPLIESTAIRRLGAEVVEFVVEPDHAAAGRIVRELGLPRDALLNIIIRGDQALPPRGSTRIEPGDHLHVLVRQEAASTSGRCSTVGATGRGGAAPPKAGLDGPARAIFSSRPWGEGTATRPGPGASASSTWSISCERAATGPVRSSCCPTAGMRTPARSRRRLGRPGSGRCPQAAAPRRRPTPSRPGGGRSSARWRIRQPAVRRAAIRGPASARGSRARRSMRRRTRPSEATRSRAGLRPRPAARSVARGSPARLHEQAVVEQRVLGADREDRRRHS